MSELSWKHKNNGLKRGDLRRAICCVTQDVHQKTMPNTWTFCTWSIEIWSGLGNVHHGSSGQDLKKERKKGTVNISELVPPYLARNNQPLGLMHSSALSQWKPVADHKFVKFGPLVPFLACFKSKACFKSEEESIPGISLALLIPSANSNLSASARSGFSSVGWSPFLVSAPSEPRPLRSKWHWGCWRRQPGRGGRRKCWIYFINCEGGIFDSLNKCAIINIFGHYQNPGANAAVLKGAEPKSVPCQTLPNADWNPCLHLRLRASLSRTWKGMHGCCNSSSRTLKHMGMMPQKNIPVAFDG